MSCKKNHKNWANKNHIGNIPKHLPPYTMTSIHTYKSAVIKERNDRFTILKDSKVNFPTASALDVNKKRFSEHCNNGDISILNGTPIVCRDITFTSPSAAVSIINGYNTNGRQALDLPRKR